MERTSLKAWKPFIQGSNDLAMAKRWATTCPSTAPAVREWPGGVLQQVVVVHPMGDHSNLTSTCDLARPQHVYGSGQETFRLEDVLIASQRGSELSNTNRKQCADRRLAARKLYTIALHHSKPLSPSCPPGACRPCQKVKGRDVPQNASGVPASKVFVSRGAVVLKGPWIT